MSAQIHPSAVIEEGASIGDGCQIGPFCHIGPDVELGENNRLHAGVVVDGHTTVGDGNEFYSYACLGKASQDLKFDPRWVTYTKIGDGNVFREYATVNASSVEGGATKIGDGCLLLSYSHIAHDCILGNQVIISTDSKLAGHVEVADNAVVNAKTGVVQFVRIGRFAFIGGFNKVAKDILPFCIADGFPSVIRAVNKIGLERNGFDPERVKMIKDAFSAIIRSGMTLSDAVESLRSKYQGVSEVDEMIEFAEGSKLGLARAKKQAIP